MPRRSNDNAGDQEVLHPVGVAGDPEATNPHEADPTPNTERAARARVNAGIIVDAFQVVGDRVETGKRTRTGAGRLLNDSTVAALQFLRQHPNQYCTVGRWAKPGAPAGRLAWAGFWRDEDGNLRAPNADEEKRSDPDSFDVRKRIAYQYVPREDGEFDLRLCLTDEDWTEPKRRGPRKPKDDVNTTFDEGADTDSDNPNLDDDETPVDEEMEPTEAQG